MTEPDEEEGVGSTIRFKTSAGGAKRRKVESDESSDDLFVNRNPANMYPYSL